MAFASVINAQTQHALSILTVTQDVGMTAFASLAKSGTSLAADRHLYDFSLNCSSRPL